MILSLIGGGCSLSYQLDALNGRDSDEVDYTGSIRPSLTRPIAALPTELDLAVARAAVSDVLNKGGKNTSVPWENPHTGARGTITPIASAYSQDGLTCHDFIASYLRNGTELWMQGEACRFGQGKWEIRNLRPWQKT